MRHPRGLAAVSCDGLGQRGCPPSVSLFRPARVRVRVRVCGPGSAMINITDSLSHATPTAPSPFRVVANIADIEAHLGQHDPPVKGKP